MTDYRVEFSVQRRDGEDEDFHEIGFGSSFDYETFDLCAADVYAILLSREWETTGDMPEPEVVDGDS